MGIFSRMRDIVTSNINAMLEKAEDPEKLIKLMIQEMEDTLVEVKSSCAEAMASRKRLARELEEAERFIQLWGDRAELAVTKGRDDLAREALVEKRRHLSACDALKREHGHCDELIEQYQEDIRQLESKLTNARDKHRTLVRMHDHARRRKQAQNGIRKIDTSDAWTRFEQFENRIERMEADADLVNYGRKGTLDERFEELDDTDEIGQELAALRRRVSGEGSKPEAE